jgi:hypothetical protein
LSRQLANLHRGRGSYAFGFSGAPSGAADLALLVVSEAPWWPTAASSAASQIFDPARDER